MALDLNVEQVEFLVEVLKMSNELLVCLIIAEVL